MYGRQQPPPAYPRQYGHGQPPQQGYPPSQQYPPQYPPQQGYPARPPAPYQHHQQPPYQPQQPPPPQQYGGQYGSQYGAPPQARGPYAQPPPMGGGPSARPLPYTPAPSAYETQAQKWKKGFSAPNGGSGSSSSSSRQSSDIEAPLLAELCSPLGSSYPPRDVLNKLLRHLPSLDHQYVCDLLDDKLEDPIWQVQGKALSVLDALFKSNDAEVFKTHYYHRACILEALCNSRKELLKARAEKLVNVVRSHVPPAPPAQEYDEQPPQQQYPPQQTQPPREEPSLLSMSPVAAPQPPPVNLLGSPNLMGMDEPAETSALPSSAFGFLNASTPTPVAQPPPQPVQEAPVSAFSFLASQPVAPVAPVQPPIVQPVVAAPAAPAHVDIFSSLPPPTPVAGLVIPQRTPTLPPPVEEEEPPVHDPIHDAFEGLDLDDDDEGEGAATGQADENPLAGFSTASKGTMGRGRNGSTAFVPPVVKIDPKDPIREIYLEIDVPAGPMGLMLDQSIPQMAVVQGFLPMPTGEKGYLEMHPVLCPGCALVGINSTSVEDKGLDEVGAILGSLFAQSKILRFKKYTRSSRVVNPANTDVVYSPPPPEVEEEEEEEVEESGESFIARLTEFSNQLDDAERQIEQLVQRDRANLPVLDMKNQLAQLHGTIEKIQTQGIDGVILGANPPANADEIRQTRSNLVKRADALTKRIQKIATHGTAPSPVVGAAVIGSPEVSAFSFVGGAGGPPMPSLQLPAAVGGPKSAFSFMQSSASPVTSPQGAAPGGSAFSFLSATPTPPAAPPAAPVFAGLNLKVNEPASIPEPEPASAFGFLSGGGQPAPPQVTSPTAFGFLRGGNTASPRSSVKAPAGSAFSFIS